MSDYVYLVTAEELAALRANSELATATSFATVTMPTPENLRWLATIDALTARAEQAEREIHDAKCALGDTVIDNSRKTLAQKIEALVEYGRQNRQTIVEEIVKRREAEARAEQAEQTLTRQRAVVEASKKRQHTYGADYIEALAELDAAVVALEEPSE